jgi:hypothetical protein
LGLGGASKPVDVATFAARFAGHPSIAVLPFKNLSEDAGQDFFSAGLPKTSSPHSAAFRTCLSSPNRRVFPFKDSKAQPAEIGRLLDGTLPA